ARSRGAVAVRTEVRRLAVDVLRLFDGDAFPEVGLRHVDAGVHARGLDGLVDHLCPTSRELVVAADLLRALARIASIERGSGVVRVAGAPVCRSVVVLRGRSFVIVIRPVLATRYAKGAKDGGCHEESTHCSTPLSQRRESITGRQSE